jgi:hypothetical protein
LGKHPAAQQPRHLLGIEFVVFGFATVDGLHVEGVPKDRRQPLSSTQVSTPVPREETFDSDDNSLSIGGNGLEQRLRACGQIPMYHDLAVVIQNTDIHGAGMQIDAAVTLVLLGVKSPEVSSS